MNGKRRIVRGFHRLGLVAGLLLGVLLGMLNYTDQGRVAHDPGPFAMAAIGFLIGWLPLRILGWIICGFMREPPSLIDSERPHTTEIICELLRRLKPEETPEQKERLTSYLRNPTPMSIHDQLERILNTPPLVSSPSLSRFLRYVVEETAAGRGAAIKEYTLGLNVFGRGDEFNPRLDPIVRVQARNLRSRLEKYYETAGAEDPIRIELPKGTYVPVFHFRTALASEAARAARCAASANAAVPTPKVDAKHC